METLLLNASFEPLKIISWQKAVTLLFLGKVEVVEQYEDEEVSSVSFSIKMPSVVRLLRLIRPRSRRVKFSRLNVFLRDKYTCQYCGSAMSTTELTYDHILPRSRGGRTEWENIVTACVPCNRQKGGRTPGEAGMRLLKPPTRPSSLPTLKLTVTFRKTPESWRDYLYWTATLVD
jgi:5-methylcytosine-specific restriction endonuclease McrA